MPVIDMMYIMQIKWHKYLIFFVCCENQVVQTERK